MSKESLNQLREDITTALYQKSEKFRIANSDKKVHMFKISSREIIAESKEELVRRNVAETEKDLPDSLLKILKTEVPKFCKIMFTEIIKLNNNNKVGRQRIIGSNTNFTATLAQIGTNNASVFRVMQDIKKKVQKSLIIKLRWEIRALNKDRKGKKNKIGQINRKQRQFLNLGHDSGFSVSEQRVQAAQNALVQFEKAGGKIPDEFYNTFEVLVKRFNTEQTDVLQVSLESSKTNKSKGASEEQSLLQAMRRDLVKLLDGEISKGQPGVFWANIEGSDSKLTKVRKRVLNPLGKVAQKNKNIKSTIKAKKIKDKNTTTPRKKPRKPKITVAPLYIDKTPTKLGIGKKEGQDARSLFSYVAMINKELPNTIRRNMGAPRLENRTGRFAASVRVQDVISTPKGHPSFGYTYEKDPYQVFEVGSGKTPWASSARDPRKIIDASIREVAGQMALGRFYTRRL
jgi:hypothetical protein